MKFSPDVSKYLATNYEKKNGWTYSRDVLIL